MVSTTALVLANASVFGLLAAAEYTSMGGQPVIPMPVLVAIGSFKASMSRVVLKASMGAIPPFAMFLLTMHPAFLAMVGLGLTASAGGVSYLGKVTVGPGATGALLLVTAPLAAGGFTYVDNTREMPVQRLGGAGAATALVALPFALGLKLTGTLGPGLKALRVIG